MIHRGEDSETHLNMGGAMIHRGEDSEIDLKM